MAEATVHFRRRPEEQKPWNPLLSDARCEADPPKIEEAAMAVCAGRVLDIARLPDGNGMKTNS
jgi:hypothetical protein